MSETPAAPAAQPAVAPAGTPTAPEAPAQETDWKAEAKKWEARAKENFEAATKLAAIEESQKTEAQKAADKIAALEAENAGFKKRDQVAAWAKEIVKGSPIPADALRGDTEADLKAHFEQLKSLIPAGTPKKGALGPYVPSEGQQPNQPLAGGDWLRESTKH